MNDKFFVVVLGMFFFIFQPSIFFSQNRNVPLDISIRKIENINLFLKIGNVKTMLIDDNLMFVMLQSYGLHIFEISNPLTPRQYGQPILISNPIRKIIRIQNYLLIGDERNGIAIIDISSIVKLHSYQASLIGYYTNNLGKIIDIELDDSKKFLYVATTNGIRTLNVSNPANPIEVMNASQELKGIKNAEAIIIKKNKMYIGRDRSEVLFYDIYNLPEVRFVTSYRSLNSDIHIRQIVLKDACVFLAGGLGGFEVIAEKTNGLFKETPIFKDELDDNMEAIILYNKTKSFMISGASKLGLVVYNVSKLDSIFQYTQIPLFDEITSLAQKDHILYVGLKKNGIALFSCNQNFFLKDSIRAQTVICEKKLSFTFPEIIDYDDNPNGMMKEIKTKDGEAFPAGITISKDGAFNWIPTRAQLGTHNLFYCVQNTEIGGEKKMYPFKVNVTFEPFSPKFPKDEQKNYVIDENTKLIIQTPHARVDDVLKKSLTYSVYKMPKEAVYDVSVRRFNWTPSYGEAGKYEFSIVAKVQENLTDTLKYNVIVRNINRPPTISSVPREVTAEVGKQLIIPFSVFDPDVEDKENLKVKVEKLPKGAVVEDVTNTLKQIKWTPTNKQAGVVKIFISVRDLGYDKNMEKSSMKLEDKKEITIKVYK